MARFVAGDVVVVPFPFSDLSRAKRRPVLVIASSQGDDLILCQITSQIRRDPYAISLTAQDFSVGSLKQASFVRPDKLFTLDASIILYSAGHVANEKLEAIKNAVISIVRG